MAPIDSTSRGTPRQPVAPRRRVTVLGAKMEFRSSPVVLTSRPARWAVAIIFLLAAMTAPAAAQISRSSYVNTIGGPTQLGGFAIKGSDVAYDPANDVYLVIHGFFGPVIGIFVDR